jgi:UDP-3-O-[3-hydroxymyristoyl] glucosamine N-acyltransferase
MQIEFTAQQIATFLKGEVDGNPQQIVNNISKIDNGVPNTLSFLANPAYEKYIYTTKASVIIVSKDFNAQQEITPTLIRVDDPYMSFTKVLQMVQSAGITKRVGIAKTAVIHPSVSIEDEGSVWISDYVVIGQNVIVKKNVQLYPHVFIDDNCVVDENTVCYSGVKVYSGTKIGKNAIIHSGAVLGSDGFGFAPTQDGVFSKIPQMGNLIIEDDVEIGANTTIDRASMGSTVIRQGAKLDNLIQVAHNCEVGKHTAIAAQTGISGSSKIGNHCMIGGQVGVSGHISIGDKVMIAAQSGIANDIADKSIVMGSPAFEASKYKRAHVHFKNIAELNKRITALEQYLQSNN